MTTTTQPQPKPVPEPDERSQVFFDGAKRGELMLSRCDDCKAWLHPAAPACTECMGPNLSWAKASGRGTVFPFGVMHQFYHPGFTNELPYNVTVVELEEGPRLNTNMVNIANEDIQVGMKVKATFVDQGGGVFIPKFEPA
jgi:uncharacterized protein